ncbi:unnamed protein product, partial [Ectocarpus fasciculatus]
SGLHSVYAVSSGVACTALHRVSLVGRMAACMHSFYRKPSLGAEETDC